MSELGDKMKNAAIIMAVTSIFTGVIVAAETFFIDSIEYSLTGQASTEVLGENISSVQAGLGATALVAATSPLAFGFTYVGYRRNQRPQH